MLCYILDLNLNLNLIILIQYGCVGDDDCHGCFDERVCAQSIHDF